MVPKTIENATKIHAKIEVGKKVEKDLPWDSLSGPHFRPKIEGKKTSSKI